MKRSNDKIKEVRRFVYPDAIITVEIPYLTEEEHARRLQKVNDASADIIMELRALKKIRDSDSSLDDD